MKRSEKSAIFTGIVLLFLAAYFTIAVLVQFFGVGIRPQISRFFMVGQVLRFAYGYSCIAVPIFLFVASILLFMPNFSVKKAVLLACSLLPFFTIVACERILNKILPGSAQQVMILKIVATIFFTLLLIVIEYVAISIVFDTISSMEKTEKKPKEKKSSKTDANVATIATSADTSTSAASATGSDVATTSSSDVAASEAITTTSGAREVYEAKEASGTKKASENANGEVGEEVKEEVAGRLETKEAEIQKSEKLEAQQPIIKNNIFAEKVSQENAVPEIPTVEELLSTTEFSDEESEVPTEKIEQVDLSGDLYTSGDLYASDDDEARFLEDPFGELDEPSETTNKVASEQSEKTKDSGEVYSINLSSDEKTSESSFSGENNNENNGANNGAQAFVLDFDKKTAMTEEVAEQRAIEKARADYPEFMSEEEKMNKTVPLMDIKLGDDDELNDKESLDGGSVGNAANDSNAKYENASHEFEEIDEADFFGESDFNDEEFDGKVTYEKQKILDPSAATVFGMDYEDNFDFDSEDSNNAESNENQFSKPTNPITIDDFSSSFDFKSDNTSTNFDDVEEIHERAEIGDEIGAQQEISEEIGEQEKLDDEIEEEIDLEADYEIENENEIDDEKEIDIPKPVVAEKAKPKRNYACSYKVPTENLLTTYPDNEYWIIDQETKDKGVKLKEILNEFKIEAEVTGIKKGPVITMFELVPAPGVKLSRIVGLSDNIALGLAAPSVRIVAPIPGKSAVGIEIPNKERAIVSFKEIIETETPAYKKMAIPVVLGKDITGEAQLLDLAKTPHLLIAGATGAGKSVCVNSIILSILYKRSPDEVKLILVDPKVVELKLYNDIPHLLTPVITEPKRAFQSLQYCLCEMERRYSLLDGMGVRDIVSYNNRIVERNIATEKLPYIVVIIDEFADLMATTGKELESTIARLAAMSRAVGIHLVLATQRPSIDVITGLIKANIPSRIAFMVASKMDSRIIIDQIGADKLLGKGDMLYASATDPFPVRIQGTYISDNEVENVVNYVKTLGEPEYIDEEIFVDDEDDFEGDATLFGDGEDPLYNQALEIVVQAGKASASYLQRRLKIGYNRAARLVEEMEERGIVGPANGAKPREIIHMP